MKYRLGLDIGIGSIGWAVISGDKNAARIENFGVRIFESGEIDQLGKDRKSQQRRGFRGTRRLVRRRKFRKNRVKGHLQNIGLVKIEALNRYFETNQQDIYTLRVKALDGEISPEEIGACLIHLSNHRGYKDFYEMENSELDEEEEADYEALNNFDKLFHSKSYRTPAECIVDQFKNAKQPYPDFKNNQYHDRHYLINRSYLKDEMNQVLTEQSKYYTCLTKANIEMLKTIIFSQRDFEDGPGDVNEKYRRYSGFLDSIGKCMFYKELDRGFRSTVISDVYAVTNTLSQYQFKDDETGKPFLKPEAAKDLVDTLLKNGNLTMTEAKKIVKSHGLTLVKSELSDDKALSKAIKYLKVVKGSVEKTNLDWQELISEEQFDVVQLSKLHQMGELISKYQTPKRRNDELKKLSWMTDSLRKELCSKKISGTSNVSYKYMCEAIKAFLNGEAYGNFQANRLKERQESLDTSSQQRLLKPLDDLEIKDNPVVFRAINETRKLINAIVRQYGSPECINLEVASDLNRSFTERARIQKSQKDNEKKNDLYKKEIADLLGIDIEEVSGTQIEKLRLYREQDGKCLYSGKPFDDLKLVLLDKTHRFEVDHIVPYSLILDNTSNNKALVMGSENQIKRQRTPLMYMSGVQRENFIARINEMHHKKKSQISDRKYNYLMVENIYDDKNRKMLSDWKSRNINDTRYITKYLIGYLKTNLLFDSHRNEPVYGIKGGITSRFRKIWLRDTIWGKADKNRESYLNHAVDAVVIANLTPAYVEISSDNIKLGQIKRHYRNTINDEYQKYLSDCLKKMTKYYNFQEDYTKRLLTQTNRVPSYVKELEKEVAIRFDEENAEMFEERIKDFYGDTSDFFIKPHLPIVSQKQERKFRGEMADSNPIRVCEIEGVKYKVKRKSVAELKKTDLAKLRTNDSDLIESLQEVLENHATVESYLKANDLKQFVTLKGQKVNQVSVVEKPITNYYRKEISEDNYSVLGGMKYHCVEVYKNQNGETSIWGLKYTDIVNRDKKLWVKQGVLPEDYSEHMMYLFKNDYIEVIDKKGEVKFSGFYKSIFNINESRLCYSLDTKPLQKKKAVTISKTDKVTKYEITLLGNKGGEIKCTEPLSLIPAKN
ncbi:type II CRISPR RNA-guided endonuclease Cas9 [Eubacteriaceae bacterium ES2]|nr:type II CRISPR RNA-guided endonuclease Cas9 [Eubacteriaceae bacterium ES2]